jgi:protein gp37
MLVGDTTISWTARPGTRGRTWNPTQGCWPVSPGCANCYACRQAARFSGVGKPFHGLVKLGKKRSGTPPKWTGEVKFAAHKLIEPLSWREPSTVFVDSMSDLFYEEFTFEQIAAVYGIMAFTKRHTYQILTKRPKRRREFFEWLDEKAQERLAKFAGVETIAAYDWRAAICWEYAVAAYPPLEFSAWHSEHYETTHTTAWPLVNVWEGVSAENQEMYNDRVFELALLREDYDIAITFVSCEPLLGPIDPDPSYCGTCGEFEEGVVDDLEDGTVTQPTCRECGDEVGSLGSMTPDWLIAGCESGPGARPCEVTWFKELRDACAWSGIAFFHKQAVLVDGVITAGDRSHKKGRGHGGDVIELPYLEGVQHANFPEVDPDGLRLVPAEDAHA